MDERDVSLQVLTVICAYAPNDCSECPAFYESLGGMCPLGILGALWEWGVLDPLLRAIWSVWFVLLTVSQTHSL